MRFSENDEWLEADGLGGFASGTATGIRTRRYHALLLTATTPPTGRMVLVNGFDERFEGYGGEDQEIAKRLRHAGIRRRQLKFAGLAVHLHHRTRAPDDPNDMSLPANRMIAETLRTRAVRCELGIDAHLAEFAERPPDLRAASA